MNLTRVSILYNTRAQRCRTASLHESNYLHFEGLPHPRHRIGDQPVCGDHCRFDAEHLHHSCIVGHLLDVDDEVCLQI